MNARTILFLALAGTFLFGCAGPSAERKKEASARMQMGIDSLQKRDLPGAMRELTRAAELDPENPEIDLAMGIAYMNRGDFAKAEQYLRAALRKKPDYADAHNNLGVVLGGLGRGTEAIAEFEAAVANVLYATPEVAVFNMGEEYRRQKNVRKAEEAYRRAIALNDRYAAPYRGLALVQEDMSQWSEMTKSLERCVEMAPAYSLAWMDLGRAYLQTGRPKDAYRAFRNVLSRSDDPALRKMATDRMNSLPADVR